MPLFDITNRTLKLGRPQNFACMEVRPSKITLWLKLNPDTVALKDNMRDMREIGHYGTGDVELVVTNEEHLAQVEELAARAVENIGG